MSKDVLNVSINVAKVAAATVVAVISAECAFQGTKMAEADGEFIKDGVKYLVDPEPIYVKKGTFGKKRIVKVNPYGEIKDYTGNKKPASNKVYKVK